MKIIENQHLSLAINYKGAELTSIFNKGNDTEYLWQADKTFWNRHAPVLFPIVGRLKDDTFIYNGVNFQMGQHGIARDMPFQILEETDKSVTFYTKSKAKTLRNYPFHFNLRIKYTLVGKTIEVAYQVVNPFMEDMYFSIGGHPGFNCPLQEGEERSDYQLVFNEKETSETQRVIDGLRAEERWIVLDNEAHIPLTNELFDNDALIFENLKSTHISLQKGKDKVLTFGFEGFPYLGIWSKNRNSPFVCIEPWFGIADILTHNQDFTEKEGIIKLEPSEVFDCSYSIEIH